MKFLVNLNSNSTPEKIKFSYPINEKSLFFGEKNYSNFKDLKNSINNNRQVFFQWFYQNSKFENKYWWMSSIFMKNNLSNNYFNNLSYLSFIKDLILQNKLSNKIIEIDSECLSLDLYNLFKQKKINFKVSKTAYLLTILKFKLKNYFILAFNIIRYLVDFNYGFILSKFFKNNLIEISNQKLKIFHMCLNKNEVFTKDKLECEYFKHIPNTDHPNYLTIKLPWIVDSDIKSKFHLLKKLNKENIINPHVFMNFNFQFKIISHIYYCYKNISFLNTYDSMSISNIIESYKYKNTSFLFQNYIFWSYENILKNIIKNNILIKFYDPFHMGISEIIQKNARDKNIYFYGYYHSFCPSSILGYNFIKNEVNSKFFPDKIILNAKSDIYKNSIKSFYSKSLFGPSIRQKIILENKNLKNKFFKYDLLFLLPLNQEFEKEALYLLNKYCTDLLRFKVAIKVHPKSNSNLSLIVEKELKDNVFIVNDLVYSLNHSKIIISVCSSSFIDALLLGKVVLSYSPSFTLDWNFPDLETKYKKNFTINFFNFIGIINSIINNYTTESNTYLNISRNLKENFNLKIDNFLS